MTPSAFSELITEQLNQLQIYKRIILISNFRRVLNVHLPAYEDGTGCSEMSAYKFQTPGNHPKESIQHYFKMF